MSILPRLSLAITLLTLWVPVQAQEHKHGAPEKLGKVLFPVSCAAGAQKEFQRGVALLHSFAYDAARNSFERVTRLDPPCAMARWGIAQTYYNQLWEPPVPGGLAPGRAAIEAARALVTDPREKLWIEALHTFYAGPERAVRQRALDYERSMEELAAAYPQDAEAKIFYALALISNAPPLDASHAKQKKAAALLEGLRARLPQHPGIVHYLIHAYDNAELARNGIRLARQYSRLAASAPHALHMPSHIFTRLGMWPDSVASNRAARAGARREGDVGEELHAMDYLTYAYLQMGDESSAALVVADMRRMTSLPNAVFKVGYAASAMPVRYALERRQWADAAGLQPLPAASPHVAALTYWARAIAQARSKHVAEAHAEIEHLSDALEQVRATGNNYWAEQVNIMLLAAKAWAAHAAGEQEQALRGMRQAAEQEDAVEKLPITPGPVIPAREQLGDLLLESGKAGEALAAFRECLRLSPRRRGCVAGAMRAADQAGDDKQARSFHQELASLSEQSKP